MVPEFANEFSSVSYLFWGTIFQDGEDRTSDCVRGAGGGPGWALAYHAAYEFGAPGLTCQVGPNGRRKSSAPIDWERDRHRAASRIVVDPARRYQIMTGFGASMTDSSAYVLTQLHAEERTRIMRELFSPTEGIGVSMLRQPMGASDFTVGRHYSYDDQPPGQTDPALSDFSIDHDRAQILPRLRCARLRTSRCTSRTTTRGWGSSRRSKPSSSQPGWHRQLRGAWLATKILAYDHNWDIPDYPDAVHGAIGPYTAGTAWHCYAGEVVTQSVVAHNNYPQAQSFQTECSGGDWQGGQAQAFKPSMDSVINVPRHWGQSVVFWNLALNSDHGPHLGGCTNCRGLVTTRPNGTVVKEPEYWALGQFSRFVRPGAVRVGSSSLVNGDADGIRNVVFQNPDGALIMVAHNSASTAKSFDVKVGARHFTGRLAAGAAATYRWRTPANLPPAGDLGYVDLDFGPGPAGTPTGRLTQSVSSDVIDHLNKVKLGRHWLVYSQPYGATIERSGPAAALSRAEWAFRATGTVDVDDAPFDNMIDKTAGTRWTSGTVQTTNMSLTVDLGREQTFTEISLDTGPSIGDYLRRYRVEISARGHRWRTVARGPGHTGEIIIPLAPTRVRLVRLVSEADSNSWWTISDLQLRNTPNTSQIDLPGLGLISDSAQLGGTAVTGHYNAAATPAVVPWPIDGFDYTYRLPPTAAVTFAVSGRPPSPARPVAMIDKHTRGRNDS